MTLYTDDHHFKRRKQSAITIGSFDGVHRGHLSLLQKMKTIQSSLSLVTFIKHPSTFFSTKKGKCSLTTLPQKLALLSSRGVNQILLYDFNQKLANLTYKEFLDKIFQKTSFSHLILGENAAFGKDRQGTPEKVTAYLQTKGITTHYISLETIGNSPITSTRIRYEIAQGNLQEANLLLGREYRCSASLYSVEQVEEGLLYQAIVEEDYCLPPDKSYSIRIFPTDEKTEAILEKGNLTFLSKKNYTSEISFSFVSK